MENFWLLKSYKDGESWSLQVCYVKITFQNLDSSIRGMWIHIQNLGYYFFWDEENVSNAKK